MKLIFLALLLSTNLLAKELYPQQTNFNNQQYQQDSLLIRYNNWQDEQKFNELVGEYRQYPTQRQRLEKQLQLQDDYNQLNLKYYQQQQQINLYNQVNPRVIYYNQFNNDYYYRYYRRPEPRYYY